MSDWIAHYAFVLMACVFALLWGGSVAFDAAIPASLYLLVTLLNVYNANRAHTRATRRSPPPTTPT
jgi:hypothetical protein